jgi:hypothetical protein
MRSSEDLLVEVRSVRPEANVIVMPELLAGSTKFVEVLTMSVDERLLVNAEAVPVELRRTLLLPTSSTVDGSFASVRIRSPPLTLT